MPEFEVVPPKATLVISIAVRPEEIELAFATNGESLCPRVLLALVAELATQRMTYGPSASTAGVNKRRGRVA
jgi:hypothetical protein